MEATGKPTFCQRLKTHWKRWLILGTTGFVVFNIATIEFTSQSFFCNSCHIMNTFYDSWKERKHADVECIKCHIPPGVNSYAWAKLNGLGQVVDDVLSRTSTKPSASVSIFSCTRSGCHDLTQMKEADRLAHRESNPRPYRFEHDKHIDKAVLGIRIHCTTCHSHIKGETHFEVNTNVCVTCHMVVKDEPATLAQEEAKAGSRTGQSFSSRIVFRPRTVDHLAVDSNEGKTSATQSSSSAGPVVQIKSDPDSSPVPEIESNSSIEEPPSDVLAENHLTMPEYRCRTCHTPPNKVLNYRGLEIDHREFVAFGTSCESCHSGVTAVPRVIDDTQCISCHDFGAERNTTLNEMHDLHSTGDHKVECFACHGITKHGPAAQTIRLERLNCTNCHERQHLVQFDTYASPKHENTPPPSDHDELPAVSPMLLVHVDCSGCHVKRKDKPDGSAVIVAAPEACNTCHQDGFGEKMIPLWQDATHRLFDEVQKRYDEVKRRNGVTQEGAAQIDTAAGLLNLVKFDGSWGVHNPQYTKRILEMAREAIEKSTQPVPSEEGP